MSGADGPAPGTTFCNEDGEWEGLPSAPEPEPEPAAMGRQEKSFASLEEAAKAAEAAGATDSVMMGIDMASQGNLMKDILGLGESGPTGKLSSTERTAKQKAKLQRGLLREATQSAQTMNKINAAARAKLRPGSLTAPRACGELPCARLPVVCPCTEPAVVAFVSRAALPELRQAHIDYLARLTGDPTVDARDGMIADRVKRRVLQTETPMKLVGSARESNRKRLALSAQLDKKARAAAKDCMTKMLTSDIVRQRSPWKDWSWIKGTRRSEHVEYHALWRGPDASSHANYCAFNVVYEDGHLGDPNYICVLAELSRPSTCFTRWALLKWGLDLQLLDAMLERLADKEQEAGRVPRCVELGESVTAYMLDRDSSSPEAERLARMCEEVWKVSDYERIWVQRQAVSMTMSKACALSEVDEAQASALLSEAMYELPNTLAGVQQLLRRSLLAAKAKAAADAAA